MLGEEEIEKVSTHRQRLELDLGSRTYSKDFRRLAAPHRVRQAVRDTALLVYGNIAPALESPRAPPGLAFPPPGGPTYQ